MNWADIKKALSDMMTPAELVELLDIDTDTLIYALESETEVFTPEVLVDLEDIINGRK